MSETTSFTLDNMGRYLCNTLQEALDSAGQTVAGHSRGFDVIVIGGGTFGSVMAESLFARDRTRSLRILMLEAGPYVLPEHAQNMPFLGGAPNFRRPWVYDPNLEKFYQFPGLLFAIGGRSLLWGGWSPELLHDAQNDEMFNWPGVVITDLKSKYLLDAADQIGVTSTNDFIHGPLHEGLRRQLFDRLKAAAPTGLVLNDLPDHPVVQSFKRRNPGQDPSDAQLREWLNLPATDTTPRADLLNLLKLEAPLAVQSVTEPGLFPFNKFSAIPLAINAARVASTEADGTGVEADARKRFMVVPDCHVQELITQVQGDYWVRVVGVRAIDRTGNSVDVPLSPSRPDGTQSVAIIALGTIETTRVAITTFKDSLAGRAAQRMGENLMAHLRSNLTIRVPKEALTNLPAASLKTLQVSALFVKGKANINGKDKYFHLQITASGLSDLGNNSEAFLFKKVPDIEQVRAMTESDSTTVVITLRGIGEMSPMNPDSRIGLAQSPGDIDFNRPAAYAVVGNALAPSGGSAQTQDDRAFWDVMDEFSDKVAVIFANGKPFDILTNRLGITIPVPAGATAADLKVLRENDGGRLKFDIRDALGTTHHEAGTLRMSNQPADGVTNEFGRIHDTTNCYVASPALFPSTGSPNPMLTGVALARRAADLLTASVLPKPPAFAITPGFRPLFDGTGVSFNRWTRVSPTASNGFALISGEIVTYGTGDFGLLYYAAEAFADFTLKVQFRMFDLVNQNSGIFLRFRDPLLNPTPVILNRIQGDDNDFQLFQKNRAWSAVHSGFEVQIDDNAIGDPRKDFFGVRPEPNGLRKNRTGAIYKIPAKDSIPNFNTFDSETQIYQPGPTLNPRTWYEYEIDVRGNNYTVDLTNLDTGTKVRTTRFQNTDAARGVASETGAPVGYVGLQSYSGSPIAFRNIQIKV
ncbi:MAG TPA: family 16 glycoside hydrolase [Blastocatellia bacterium]|nr:family 16 glycoside hydrolase [Blastocatellia bacterium]